MIVTVNLLNDPDDVSVGDRLLEKLVRESFAIAPFLLRYQGRYVLGTRYAIAFIPGAHLSLIH